MQFVSDRYRKYAWNNTTTRYFGNYKVFFENRRVINDPQQEPFLS